MGKKLRSAREKRTWFGVRRASLYYAQMVADWLCVPEDKIHLAPADTDEVAIGRGTYASRSMMIAVMNAILDALAPLGVADVPMPATPERVWHAIHEHTRG
jgi:CO/xanthine dehydrogenase Mo-binding subunit